MIVTLRVQVGTNDEREGADERIRAQVERALAERFTDLSVTSSYFSIPVDVNQAYRDIAEYGVPGEWRVR